MRQMLIGDNGPQRLQTQQSSQTQQRSARDASLSARNGAQMREADAQHDKMLLRRALKKKRSTNYLNLIRTLDAGGQQLDQTAVNALLGEIADNLGPLDLNIATPLGIIAACYLGDPYEVHVLDIVNNIIEHYVAGRPLPGALESYRGMAMKGSYEFIEVYSNCACAVRPNGAVTVIET